MDNTQGINNEEVQEEIFSPFNENVIERDYTRPNVQGQIDINPIDEPILIAPTFEDLQSAFQSNLDGDNSPSVEGDSDSSGGGWSGGANESMNELDNKEKKQASSAMVDAVLDGYQQVWKFANEQIKISPKKVNKLVKDGEINPNVGVPVQGGQLPFLQFVDVYNKELDGVLEVDDEFKEKVKPVMQRVFMKRNIGMTDEQLLMYYFGIDIISKGATMYTIIGQNKELLNSIKEMSIGAPTPPPTGARTYEEPKTAQTERAYEEPAPTREYKEPEEKKAKPTSEYEEVEVIAEEPKPKTRTTKKADTGLPKFGDADLLAHMESIANKDTPTKGTRGRRKKI